ncbi:MAG TPA: NUDIX hydrolase [Gammaproteobacteria bacterium]|nr:NUDIX hydrolase [Gammaproteobacteria bacterium]
MKTLYQGSIIRLETGKVTMPDGHSLSVEVVHHPGGSAIVAINDLQEVCILRQYRFILNDWIWELPAGKCDNNEAPIKTAKRELQEEAGLIANHWHTLGESISSPGVFTERVWFYLATGLEQIATAQEQGECMEVHWQPLDKLVMRCMEGGIEDGKTIIGLMRAAAFLKQNP